ncbi:MULTISPECIES: hypothetical protein [Methanobacterium]|uniref:Uncharacterized protein n=1 Tax=Methanobacterium veterum TaxID=408577 RepID=A0A9E5A3W5_9EURY|nr:MULTISPECIES: hypothetical protein [Methanobacterium]MCZ3365274.1 hypothetical protein [Methanobacterium veterum]MCZ3373025.1 hypothetical protein [Methanobacterium veterum]
MSERQLKELRNYAEQTGENPISYHIRQAITNTYNNKKESEKRLMVVILRRVVWLSLKNSLEQSMVIMCK